ncbi:aspartate aminotransferase family protein [Pseudahrensia aquimaris]|uniref:Acetylornithine aminotransferase n=1 Tax=Pseudahrensia aquimaris TaxID=744461 RepID=A0ABW3FGM6_9HYPH
MAPHPAPATGDTSPIFNTFARKPLRFERGEGSRLFTEDGETYLDFAGGIAVMALGHSHPVLVETIKNQAEKLWHVSNLYDIPGQTELGNKLVENTFADKVFFTNSGTEALELAFKTARRLHYANGNPERIDILTFDGAFHGRSLAAIAATGNEKYLEGFGPKVEGFIQLPFGDHEALKEAAARETTAAILIEPVQGEGGIRPVPHQCLRGLRQLCDQHGILLIYDEVQCGVGRTGKFFAHEWASNDAGSAEPDIMAVAKGIGGGFPLGACLATAAAAEGMTPGSHGTTYGGNPLAMAVGNAVIDLVLEEGFLEDVQDKAIWLRQRLAELVDSHSDLLDEVRGEGLLQGLKCKASNLDVVAAFQSEHLLSVPAGDNVVRLLPPLNVELDVLADAVNRMDAALTAMGKA